MTTTSPVPGSITEPGVAAALALTAFAAGCGGDEATPSDNPSAQAAGGELVSTTAYLTLG